MLLFDAPGAAKQIVVEPETLSARLVKKVDAEYPPLAKEARVTGVVRFRVTVGVDGAVRRIDLVSGHPLLVLPARRALEQWRYDPILVDGKPVEAVSTVEVGFD